MPDTDTRVAVYIDFDNIVISRYDQKHGRGKWREDRVNKVDTARLSTTSTIAAKVEAATVDIGAILDFASSFGTIVISRAYADWSVDVNAGYRRQLIDRAVDLVQLFTVSTGMKNGADIRLAVDVVEDLFRLDDISHVVIVAGDSDYIALAQRTRRLGRHVVGIGVAGSTSASLAAACDEFVSYDDLPGLDDEVDDDIDDEPEVVVAAPAAKAKAKDEEVIAPAPNPQKAATRLLTKALQLLHSKEDAEWIPSPSVKNQILRMDPTFSEKALNYGSFTDFVKSRGGVVEIDDSTGGRKLRLKPTSAKATPAAKKK
jgi:hypothetical protein